MAALDDRVRARLERLEIEARERPRRHAVRLIALIVLGYSYPLALFAVSFGIVGLTLAFAPQALQHTGVQEAILYTLLIVVELVGVALILQSFRVEFPAPAHHLLRSGEAPALQELVRESASRTGAAPVERIYIKRRVQRGRNADTQACLLGRLDKLPDHRNSPPPSAYAKRIRSCACPRTGAPAWRAHANLVVGLPSACHLECARLRLQWLQTTATACHRVVCRVVQRLH